MKKQTDPISRRLCLLLGVCLLVIAAILLLCWQGSIRAAQQNAAIYADTILRQIPAPQSAALEERRDNTMPLLSIGGTDFIGILELPQYDCCLPVCGDWGGITRYPCRLSGSVYDRSLQIGGTSQQGQYDFYREISVGDRVFFTDMEGNRYAYTVGDIHYEKHADQAALQQRDAALTLFIKNIYAFEYIILSCDAVS